MQGKSRGSVRESGDLVEHLEGCSGARACTFGELGARGWRAQARGRGSGEREVRRWRARAHGSTQVGARARCAGWRAGARGTLERARCRAATGVLFTREHVLHLKSPK
ncbi:hypothetical protein CRG98_019889 [Punica granatum]|uniref:Uncharacterized protein n=1 Tax=Punica granatum TaxID=22663 RepID=A0A2I0JV40_PUNGR|nr:hypothetical protein CRG98_019889 [Punica granatum]